jgi:exodeoxyribonuclease V beta subunit
MSRFIFRYIPFWLASFLFIGVYKIPLEYSSADAVIMSRTSHQSLQTNTFNLAHSHLGGFNLIDASAGTGKTYAICALVMRLLLEKSLGIDQVLVVTYTEAATEDLRQRIRQKLRQTLQALEKNQSDDPFLQEYLPLIANTDDAKQQVADALRGFDEAAICTIHSFCQRMLLENSFESNTLFDSELVADDSHILREVAEDYWRLNFYNESDLFSQYAAEQINPDILYNFLTTFLPHPALKFVPAFEPDDLCFKVSALEKEYRAAYKAVCEAWSKARAEASKDLLYSEALNRITYRKEKIPALLAAMEAMAAAGKPSTILFDDFKLLTRGTIISKTKSKHTPNTLPFYDLCENLQQCHSALVQQYDSCLIAKKKKLTEFFRSEFDKRKEQQNIFSFDDLLRKVHGAISGVGGVTFARNIAEKYRAVLIDEFQDTDPLQLEIFTTICKDRTPLFLIGDPKQAIYSFRGADIFTYMDAAASTQLVPYTLNVNHRSTPGLVKAVNTLFSSASLPFVYDAITFQPVEPAPKEKPESLTIDGRQEPPFIVWHISKKGSGANKEKLTKTVARQIIITAVAAEITNLLALAADNRAYIDSRKLLPGDIAILVRKNDEARKMQEALTARQVPSVLHSGENLFVTWEAREMTLLLEGVGTPGSLPMVKTALLTRIIGLEAATIDPVLPGSESMIEKWLLRFRNYHEIWNRHGFIQMFWTIMAENQVRERLLAMKNGERSLTNFLHLAEVLHQEAAERGLNITALIDYLHEKIADQQTKNVEHQLRLESDADRVKIITIHKAKGLEYPVVFCPFTWEGSRLSSAASCICHLREGSDTKSELVFDVGSPDLNKHLQLAREEELAENLRLLYVALTRAVHRCYLFWGSFKGADTSAPAYLLHQGPAAVAARTGPDLKTYVTKRYASMSDEEIGSDLQSLARTSGDTISVRSSPAISADRLLMPKDTNIDLRCREFTGTVAADWKISSFSSLISSRPVSARLIPDIEETLPGRDDFPLEPTPHEKKQSPAIKKHDIFSFPHGPEAGTMLHDLLEKIDFSIMADNAGQNLVYKKLQQYGYDSAWAPALTQMLIHLAKVSLHHEIPQLQFSNIPKENCLHELEFYYPLTRIIPETLKSVFGSKALNVAYPEFETFMDQQLDKLTFSPSMGFMKGFIDLVFKFGSKYYLVDWKSNYLGAATSDYHRDRLNDIMVSGFYFLQYHIYCLALYLYLENRLPGFDYATHFGGVFYVFLRGIDHRLGADYGIFHGLPTLSLMDSLRANLIAESITC